MEYNPYLNDSIRLEEVEEDIEKLIENYENLQGHCLKDLARFEVYKMIIKDLKSLKSLI